MKTAKFEIEELENGNWRYIVICGDTWELRTKKTEDEAYDSANLFAIKFGYMLPSREKHGL